MYVHVYRYMYMYMFMYMYVCVFVFVFVYAYAHAYVYMRTCVHVYVHVHVYLLARNQRYHRSDARAGRREKQQAVKRGRQTRQAQARAYRTEACGRVTRIPRDRQRVRGPGAKAQCVRAPGECG